MQLEAITFHAVLVGNSAGKEEASVHSCPYWYCAAMLVPMGTYNEAALMPTVDCSVAGWVI
eukprot:6193099-Pleurochrysis_carterae.AAC.4